MEKYEKLFKGLEMCAGPDCNPECPYHGETRGGKTCRAWLLNDAAEALALEVNRADKLETDANFACERIGIKTHNIKTLTADLLRTASERDTLREELEKAKKTAQGLEETMECALKATMQAEYWRGQANALKDFLHFYCGDQTVEGMSLDLPDMHGEPEPEDDGHV